MASIVHWSRPKVTLRVFVDRQQWQRRPEALQRRLVARPAAALEILEALRIYRGDEKAVTLIKAAVEGRGELAREIGEIFG